MRVGLGSSSSFVVPGPAAVHVSEKTPCPSAAISIWKNIALKVNAYTFFSQHVCHSTLPNLFVWSSSIGLKTVRTASNVHQKIAIKGLFYVPQKPRKCIQSHLIFKIFPGKHAPDPLAGLGLRPSFSSLYTSWLVSRNIPEFCNVIWLKIEGAGMSHDFYLITHNFWRPSG